VQDACAPVKVEEWGGGVEALAGGGCWQAVEGISEECGTSVRNGGEGGAWVYISQRKVCVAGGLFGTGTEDWQVIDSRKGARPARKEKRGVSHHDPKRVNGLTPDIEGTWGEIRFREMTQKGAQGS